MGDDPHAIEDSSSSSEVDSGDIVQNDLVADMIVRILSSPFVTEGSKDKEKFKEGKDSKELDLLENKRDHEERSRENKDKDSKEGVRDSKERESAEKTREGRDKDSRKEWKASKENRESRERDKDRDKDGDKAEKRYVKHREDKEKKEETSKEKPAFSMLQVQITAEEAKEICFVAEKSFGDQQPLLEIDRDSLPIVIVGDLHGNLPQLLRIFYNHKSPQTTNYLFLGDYVDRGVQGIEVMLLLFCLKIRYPSQVYLLRGNHEDVNPNLSYGFYEECLNRWRMPSDEEAGVKVWKCFLNAFNWMPMAAIIGGKVFCCHGGISPFMENINDINNKVIRPSIIPAYGVMCDLVWADPSPDKDEWVTSHRGISFTFGKKATEDFCAANGIDIIIRGHQISLDMYRNGYKFMCGGRIITIFSSVNYNNQTNNSCVAVLNKQMHLSFVVYRCKVFSNEKKQDKKKRLKKEKSFFKREKEKEKENVKENSKEKEKTREDDCDTLAGPPTVATAHVIRSSSWKKKKEKKPKSKNATGGNNQRPPTNSPKKKVEKEEKPPKPKEEKSRERMSKSGRSGALHRLKRRVKLAEKKKTKSQERLHHSS